MLRLHSHRPKDNNPVKPSFIIKKKDISQLVGKWSLEVFLQTLAK